jgi:hypothetical protein
VAVHAAAAAVDSEPLQVPGTHAQYRAPEMAAPAAAYSSFTGISTTTSGSMDLKQNIACPVGSINSTEGNSLQNLYSYSGIS